MLNSRRRSEELYDLLCDVIPGGVNSPVRAFKGLNCLPMVAERGAGDLIWDSDGNCYIDYCCSWGALVHGHAHPAIVTAAQQQMALGSSFGITTESELKLARAILAHLPSMESLRFVSTGTEATMSAVRLARAFTGRSLVVKFEGHYHGHADGFLIQAGSGVFGNTAISSSAGVPQDYVRHTICLPYNDVEAIRALFADCGAMIAAVIVEPVAGNMGVVPPDSGFLQVLRQETQNVGALLILDEVMTGFRVSLKSAQGIYGVDPDLTCLGKIIGGGFPVAAFGGKRAIMQLLAPLGTVYQAGTLSGNPVAMAAGIAALELLTPDLYEELERKTAIITVPVATYLRAHNLPACIQRVGSMFTLFFGCRSVRSMADAKGLNLQLFSRFFNYLFERGIYPPPLQYEAWFVSAAHTDSHLEYTRDVILDFLKAEGNAGFMAG